MGSEIWCSSDHHFGHFNMTCAQGSKNFCNRPWDDVDDMNEALITLWNEAVGVWDIVYYLGDFAMGKIGDTLPLASQLHGFKVLIPGNHDRCWEGNKKYKKWRARYAAAGLIVPPSVPSFDGFDLCHFPFSTDDGIHEYDKYAEYRPIYRKNHLIHGHVHDSWTVRPFWDVKQINVGVDVWNYSPVHIDAIKALV